MLENIFPKTPTKLISAEVERCHGYVTLIVIIIESFKNLWPTFRLFSISNRKMENSPGTQIIISRLLPKKNSNFNWLLRSVFQLNMHSEKAGILNS